MNVVFRSDASLDIGIGHVMRCLTLAQALKAVGAECRFVCRDHSDNTLDIIFKAGFEAHLLPGQQFTADTYMREAARTTPEPAHAFWLGASWQIDASQTIDALGDASVDWLIVDHYGIDERWEHELRSYCRRLMVIDDLADRPHDCDVLLDQNLGRTEKDYYELVAKDCVVLTGPRFALLRPEFAQQRDYSMARRSEPKLQHVLISMGGVDKMNATAKVLDALLESELPEDCHLTVVMGENAPWIGNVRDIAQTLPWQTEVLVNVDDIARVMAESDLSIGAAGSTSWERCSLGLPAIITVLAENQEQIAQHLEIARAARIVDIHTLKEDIVTELARIIESPGVLAQISASAAEITDGTGTDSVVSRLLSKVAA